METLFTQILSGQNINELTKQVNLYYANDSCLLLLCEIVCKASLDIQVRQFAAIELRKKIKDFYKTFQQAPMLRTAMLSHFLVEQE